MITIAIILVNAILLSLHRHRRQLVMYDDFRPPRRHHRRHQDHHRHHHYVASIVGMTILGRMLAILLRSGQLARSLKFGQILTLPNRAKTLSYVVLNILQVLWRALLEQLPVACQKRHGQS